MNRPAVDPERIALMGISLGGLLAPRAAAFEHRLAACIANDGLYSFQFGEMGRSFIEGDVAEDLQHVSEGDIEEAVQELMRQDTGVRWAMENGKFTFQANSIFELLEKTEPYTLDGVADKIICPTLVCEAGADHFFSGQPQQLYDALTCPKTYRKFTKEEGAEEHCHFGALQLFNHYVFEWLDQTLPADSK
ncbi:alpha/beta hydrolase family protein [Bacillus sp. SD088]|uniref:alpha/beta hydrolase family protein n=1 Tax=Bacillus sp. SD088 TaxID=2782012 RepID=UPI001F612935|nr:hypothetical protein [Bacillus sp. SD088]